MPTRQLEPTPANKLTLSFAERIDFTPCAVTLPAPSLSFGGGCGARTRTHRDPRPAALIAYDVCRRALTPSDPAHQRCRGHGGARLPDDIAPRPEDYVFLKRRPSAFYGTGITELLHMQRRNTIIIGGGATNRGVETSVCDAFNLDLACVVARECCWSSDAAAHAYSLDKAMKMYARIRSLDQVTAMLRE